jgi:hypothetical protein
MKNLCLLILSFLFVLSANAAGFKCFASKYPSDMDHNFEQGFVILTVKKKTVNLRYYYVNTVARQTTLNLDLNYKIGQVMGGNGQVQGMYATSLQDNSPINFPGDSIDTIYFDKAIIEGKVNSGIVGKFAFTGHGYSWDWNVCYNQI